MKLKIFTQEHLKVLACLLMLLDHVGCARLIPGFYAPLRIIGRLAFPIFCFLLCQGFFHTRSKEKYLLRLGIGMLLSEVPFDLFCYGKLSFAGQSVMVTLFLAFTMAMLLDKIKSLPLKLIMILPFYILAELLNTDYGGAGVLMVAVFLFTEHLPHKRLLQTAGLLAAQLLLAGWKLWVFGFAIPMQFFALFAMIPIAMYNGNKTANSKILQWGFYLFYPVHMLILFLFL